MWFLNGNDIHSNQWDGVYERQVGQGLDSSSSVGAFGDYVVLQTLLGNGPPVNITDVLCFLTESG